jgi:hypothetical protein
MKVYVSPNSFVAIHRRFGVTLCLHNLPRRLVQLVTPKLCYLSTKLHWVTSVSSSDSLLSSSHRKLIISHCRHVLVLHSTGSLPGKSCIFAWVILLYIISEPLPNVLKPSSNTTCTTCCKGKELCIWHTVYSYVLVMLITVTNNDCRKRHQPTGVCIMKTDCVLYQVDTGFVQNVL